MLPLFLILKVSSYRWSLISLSITLIRSDKKRHYFRQTALDCRLTELLKLKKIITSAT